MDDERLVRDFSWLTGHGGQHRASPWPLSSTSEKPGDDRRGSALHRFEAPAILYRSKDTPGITMCAYASCHTASSTTRFSR